MDETQKINIALHAIRKAKEVSQWRFLLAQDDAREAIKKGDSDALMRAKRLAKRSARELLDYRAAEQFLSTINKDKNQ
jgi:hypothetical protein